MKKLLIPILTTAAIAPVATTLVACGPTTLKLTNPAKYFGEENVNTLESKKITFKKGASYTLLIQWDDCMKYNFADTSDGFLICVGDLSAEEGEGASIPDYDSVKVWVNEKEMKKTSKDDEGYDYLCSEGSIATQLRTWNLKAHDVIKVQFKLKEVPKKYKTTTAKIIYMK